MVNTNREATVANFSVFDLTTYLLLYPLGHAADHEGYVYN